MLNTFLLAIFTAISVISFNIRVGGAPDGINSWENRKPATIAMIEDQKPDFLTIQEGMEDQMRYIEQSCIAEYQVIGIAPDSHGTKGEHMTMFYRKDRFECLDWGTFWLSDTPDKFSTGWDGAYPRTATWAKMKIRQSGEIFFIVNTHLDHVGVTAREKGLELILSQVEEMNKEKLPVVITGDFNCTVENSELQPIIASMSNSRTQACRKDSKASFNDWGRSASNIDFIWYKGFRKCRRFKTITRKYADKPFISDHYPIKAVLEF